jgi:hypothetical protein
MKTSSKMNYISYMRPFRRMPLIIAACLCVGPAAFADVVWVGGTAGDWFEPSNWQGGTPWTDSGTTSIGSGNNAIINIDGSSDGANASVLGTLDISGRLNISSSSSLSAPVITINNTTGNSSDGWLQVQPGTHVTANNIFVGQETGANNGILTLYSATVENIHVGAAGTSGNIVIFYKRMNEEYEIGLLPPVLDIGAIHIAGGNSIAFQGEELYGSDDGYDYGYYAQADMWSWITGSSLDVYVDGTRVTDANVDTLFTITYPVGAAFTFFTAGVDPAPLPEPATYTVLAGLALLAWTTLRRRER